MQKMQKRKVMHVGINKSKKYLKGYIGSISGIQLDLVLVLGDFCPGLDNSHVEI